MLKAHKCFITIIYFKKNKRILNVYQINLLHSIYFDFIYIYTIYILLYTFFYF